MVSKNKSVKKNSYDSDRYYTERESLIEVLRMLDRMRKVLEKIEKKLN